MLGDLIAGYGSDSSDGSEGEAAVEKKEVKKAEEVKKEEPPAKPKRKLPSARCEIIPFESVAFLFACVSPRTRLCLRERDCVGDAVCVER